MIINCTPHALNIITDSGTLTLPRDTTRPIPRASLDLRQVAELATEAGLVAITQQVLGAPVDLPEPVAGVRYVVSRITAEAAPLRTDLLFPGPAVRDADGQIVGCNGLSRL